MTRLVVDVLEIEDEVIEAHCDECDEELYDGEWEDDCPNCGSSEIIVTTSHEDSSCSYCGGFIDMWEYLYDVTFFIGALDKEIFKELTGLCKHCEGECEPRGSIYAEVQGEFDEKSHIIEEDLTKISEEIKEFVGNDIFSNLKGFDIQVTYHEELMRRGELSFKIEFLPTLFKEIEDPEFDEYFLSIDLNHFIADKCGSYLSILVEKTLELGMEEFTLKDLVETGELSKLLSKDLTYKALSLDNNVRDLVSDGFVITVSGEPLKSLEGSLEAVTPYMNQDT